MKRPRPRTLRITYRVAAWLVLPAFAIAQTTPPVPLAPSTTTVTASSPTLLLPGSLTLNGTVASGGANACCGVPTGNLVFAADGTAPNALGSAPLQIIPSTQTMAYAANQAPQYSFTAAGSPTGLATGAFFGDGYTDLAVTDSADPSPTFFQGQGQGQIALNKKVTINGAPTTITSAKAVASGDFTGTGTADLIFLGRVPPATYYYSQGTSADVVYLNQGNNNFNAVVSPDGAVCNSCSGLVPYDGESITVGNFNSNVDTMNDIAYIISQPGMGTGSMGLALNKGKGSFTSFTSIPLPSATTFAPAAITSGNFDGNVDLVVTGTEATTCTISGTSSGPFNGYVAVYPGDGNGDFGIPQTINGVQTFAAPQPICVGENPTAIAVGDFNKDGNLDILVANSGAESAAPSVQLLFGDGKGGFPTNQTISLSANSGNLVSLSVADFNGDTYPDFAVYDSNGNLSFYTNNGSASPGQFHFLIVLPTAKPAGDGTSVYGAVTGDFNSDGFPDVATFSTQLPTATGGYLWIATDSASAQATLTTPSQSLQAGNRNITTSFAGDTNFAASTSTPLPVTVSQTVPVITWNPAPIVYPTPLGSAQLDATISTVVGGGSFVYTPPAGTILPMPSSSTPAPVVLTVAFTPVDGFDYAPAADSASVLVSLPKAVGTANVPTTATPGEQPTIQLTLDPYPVDTTVNITLTFTATSSNPPSTNGSVMFPNGTTTDSFVVPANTTAALPPVTFSAGLVAGTLSVSFSLVAGGADITPANLTTPVSITVPPSVPDFQTVTLDCSSTGIQVVVQGYSSTREISGAQVVFTAAPGQSLQTSTFTISGAQQLFTSYYQSAASDAGGSHFTLTQPFTFSSGNSSDINSVSVTLTNGQGPAQSTAQCTSATN